MCVEGDYFLLFPAVLTSILWIWILYRKFEHKLV
jgi:hypothetical protein